MSCGHAQTPPGTFECQEPVQRFYPIFEKREDRGTTTRGLYIRMLDDFRDRTPPHCMRILQVKNLLFGFRSLSTQTRAADTPRPPRDKPSVESQYRGFYPGFEKREDRGTETRGLYIRILDDFRDRKPPH
jgi:hypothetical protein